MDLFFWPIYILGRVDRIEIRPGGTQVHPFFRQLYNYSSDKKATVWLNGKRTNIVLPDSYRVELRGKTEQGRVFGRFWADFSGAYSWTSSFAFHTLNGTVEFIRSERLGSSIPIAQRGGAIVGRDYDDFPGGEPDEVRVRSWGWLYKKGRTESIGPANDLWFNRDGSVAGYFLTDKKGNPGTAVMVDWEPRYRLFQWRAGKQILGKLLTKKPRT